MQVNSRAMMVAARARVVAVCAWILGLVFVWAATSKIHDLPAFVESIDNFHAIPPAWSPYLALAVPCFEVVVAGALFIGYGRRGAGLVAMGMLVLFTAAMIQALVRGINLDCGCFGSSTPSHVGLESIARNAALLGLACAVVFLRVPTLGTGPKAPEAPTGTHK